MPRDGRVTLVSKGRRTFTSDFTTADAAFVYALWLKQYAYRPGTFVVWRAGESPFREDAS